MRIKFSVPLDRAGKHTCCGAFLLSGASAPYCTHLFCMVRAEFHSLLLAAESYYWAATSVSTTVGPWSAKLIKKEVQSQIP